MNNEQHCVNLTYNKVLAKKLTHSKQFVKNSRTIMSERKEHKENRHPETDGINENEMEINIENKEGTLQEDEQTLQSEAQEESASGGQVT